MQWHSDERNSDCSWGIGASWPESDESGAIKSSFTEVFAGSAKALKRLPEN